MKCLKICFMVFLLVVFVSVYSGFSQEELTINPYLQLQKQYQKITEELNQLVILSQKDLIEWNSQLPELVNQAKLLQVELTTLLEQAKILKESSKILNQDLEDLLDQLRLAKSDLEKLLDTLADSEVLMKIFGEQIKTTELKTNIGLIVSITAVILAAGALAYNIKKEGL